jgi:beta-lactamase superfamily II metal-dependent hydrolase
VRFQINDVGHGFCAFAIAQNGNCMLVDCGHKTDPENRPSVFLPQVGVRRIELFVVSNYDEDHISDLPAVRRTLPISLFLRNGTITREQLRALKLKGGPITEAMKSLLDMMPGGVAANPASLPGVAWTAYWNRYPGEFQDTNNLSVVTFLRMGGLSVVMPGDLEVPGWQALLAVQAFRDELKRVNVFVASHHGREGGYCEEVFNYCHPNVIIFSDGPVQYETQEDMAGTYGVHASGVTFNGESRRVLSTRTDGTLTWSI